MTPHLAPLGAVAILALAPAAALAYNCSVPRALLCENCARDIVITLNPGGACRVSFAPAAGASNAGSSLSLRFQIFAPRTTIAQRWRPPRPRYAQAPAKAPAPPAARCFSFNGSQYCE